MSNFKKPSIKYKQVGFNLILIYKKNSRTKAENYTLTIKNKEERTVLIKKILGSSLRTPTGSSDVGYWKQRSNEAGHPIICICAVVE